MCMSNVSRGKLNVKYAWKVLSYNPYRACWRTPLQDRNIYNNQLIAVGRCNNRGNIESGAIHCFRTKKDAVQSQLYSGWEFESSIFKVEGIGEVGHNDKEVAFKHIKFVDTVGDWEI